MFNRGGTSAYGRGITSNLVTEEQRQRFNYGGRVRANVGFYSGNEFDPIERTAPGFSWNFPRASELFGYEDRINRPDWMVKREKQQELMGLEDPEDYAGDYSDVLEQDKVVEKVDGTNEVMTDSDWMDLLGPTEEQKKRTKGEAQLGLAAGALDVFSQPSIAKGMKAASPHLSKLGQTAMADQKARDKAILQGKVLSKVYTDRAGAKGKADISLAEWKKNNASETDLTDIESYIGTTTAWKNKTKEKKMSGETHQDLIGTFDEEVAEEAIVINPQTTGIGKDAVTTIPEGDQKKLDSANEGDTIIIGEEIFVKDSNAPGGMRKVSYTQLKKLRQGKKKKAKTYLDLAQGV